jgi:methyltransferase (TIGR00027 family)
MPAETTIQDALDMACFTAAQRALESKRERPLVRDPYAELLAGERGAALLDFYVAILGDARAIALRSAVYDEMLVQSITREKIDTVINLAAGFDTRPYRLTLPPELRWIEADLPEVLAYKSERLSDAQPVCRLERVELDVSDATALDNSLAEICSNARNVLVLTEGLLIYLHEEQVRQLASALQAHQQIGWWLAELVSPLMLQNQAEQWNAKVADCARVRFAPGDGTAFFSEYGWQVAEFRPAVAEAIRLKLPMRQKWLIRLLLLLGVNKNQRSNGFVLFKRAPAGEE